MNNQRKWLTGVVVLLVLMNLTILAFFWLGNRPPSPRKISNHFIKELNLDEVQATKFKTLFDVHMERNRQIFDSTNIYKEKLFSTLVQPNRDTTILNELTEKIANLEVQRDKLLVEHYLDLENACKSEAQKEKLREIFIRSIPKPKKRPRR